MRKYNVYFDSLSAMLDPELRSRELEFMHLPILNFIEPETMDSFIDMIKMFKAYQYL